MGSVTPEKPDDHYEWICAHRAPIPGVEPHPVPLYLTDLEARPTDLPAHVFEQLAEGTELLLVREPRPDAAWPDFTVWTTSHVRLGRVQDWLRKLLELGLRDGFSFRAEVFVAVPWPPPTGDILVEISVLTWFPPEERASWLGGMVTFKAREVEL